MRVGVSGAFGFLGANITVAALAAGHQVVAGASRTTAHPMIDPGRVKMVRLDIMDRDSVARAFDGCDAIIHAAGAVDFRKKARRRVWDINVLGSMNVYEAALALGVKKLLDLSSVNALGPSPNGAPLTEDSAEPYHAASPIMFRSSDEALAAVDASASGDYSFIGRSRLAYYDSKLAALELSRRYVRERGLPALTVYPGTAVGPGDVNHAISRLVDGVWEGRLGLTYPGVSSFMDVRDFAAGVMAALERGRVGQGYILAGGDCSVLSYAAFMDLVARVAADTDGRSVRRGKTRVLPRWLAMAATGLAETLVPSLGLGAAMALSGSLVNAFSSGKAARELGYAPSTPLERSIADCRAFSLALRAGTPSTGAAGRA